MYERLAQIETRFDDVQAELAQPDAFADQKRFTALSREFKELNKVVPVIRKHRQLHHNLENARQVLATETDPEFLEMARQEVANLEPQVHELEEELKALLVPRDPEDSMNVVLEIRAGTGGDEAALFAGDLFRMYQRYAETQGWKLEVTDFSEGTMGGYKEITAIIEGEEAYGRLKFESGVHRVQRVPSTETQGRVHTSAASVVMMPQPEDVEVEVNERDVRIDRFCASGNGGQSVNTTYSAVRLTHEPTGVVVSMQNERSQLKNLEAAWKILRARLYELELEKRKNAQDQARRSMVSTGDRSAKIRTYNFPQNRLTDHRIDLTLYNLTAVMEGDLDDIIQSLRVADRAARLSGETVGV